MKVLIQRVTEAEVEIGGRLYGKIGKGMLIFHGVEKGDTENDLRYLVHKVAGLRIFENEQGKMNISIREAEGEVLVISQFTLSADCRKGTRPSFDAAEEPFKAKEMYTKFIARLREDGLKVSAGDFGAHMQVRLTNDGPVSIMIDSKK